MRILTIRMARADPLVFEKVMELAHNAMYHEDDYQMTIEYDDIKATVLVNTLTPPAAPPTTAGSPS